MSETASATQKAVYTALTNSTEINTITGLNKVFDHQVTKTDFPYIILSNWQVSDWSTDTDDGEVHNFELEVWDQNRSRKRLHEIVGIVRKTLHDQDISLDQGHLVNLRNENSFFSSKVHTNIQLARLNFRAAVEY